MITTTNRIDTLFLGIPTDLISITDSDKFQRGTIDLMDGTLKSQSLTTKEMSGLNKISVGYGEGNTTEVQISAKILGNSYLDGITSNNIEGVFDTIRKYGYIDFDTNEVIENSDVRRVDVFKNMKVGENVGDYIDSVKYLMNNSMIEKSNKWGSESVVLRRNVKSYNERIICYDKHTELLRGKNKSFLNQFDKSKILGGSMGVMRVETNNTGKGVFQKIRERFNTETNKLSEILESEENVVWNIYNRMKGADTQQIIKPNKTNEWMKLDLKTTWNEQLIDTGYRSIVMMLKGDYELCKSYVQSHYNGSSKPTRSLKMMKEYCREYNRWESLSQLRDTQFEIKLKEIETFLKVS
jgi:hypothetical protein